MFIFDEKSNVNSKYQSDSIQFFYKSFYGTFVNTFVRNKKNLTFSICIYVLIIEHLYELDWSRNQIPWSPKDLSEGQKVLSNTNQGHIPVTFLTFIFLL